MILAYEKRYSKLVELDDKILHSKVNRESEFLTFDWNYSYITGFNKFLKTST